MSEADYYPLGAYADPNAPWNDSRPDEREFDVTISQTLSKHTTVNTDDYYIESSYLDADEGGGYVDEINTKETNWKDAYNQEHLTPLELIDKFKEILKNPSSLAAIALGKEGKYLIEECSNWVEDDIEVCEE